MVDAVHERFNIDLHLAVGAWHDFAQALGSCPTVSVGTSSRRFSAIACLIAVISSTSRVTGQRPSIDCGETALSSDGGDEFVRLAGRKTTTLFHTSHPQLCQALRRDKRWRQLSGNMVGNNKARSGNSIRRSQAKRGAEQIGGGGYGGHFRAVQGFRYYGQVGLTA